MSWVTGTKAWLARQGRTLGGVLKQAIVPVVVSLGWAAFKTLEASGKWTDFLGNFVATLAVMSILASQWFRVSKQQRDNENHGNLRQDVASLTALAQQIYAAQRRAGAPILPPRNAPPQAIEARPIKAAQLAQSPLEFLAQARELLGLGQGLPAMWLAAMGFERAVRDAGLAYEIKSNLGLTPTLRLLSRQALSPGLIEELLLLARLRNQIAHPIDKTTISPDADAVLEPDRIVEAFAIGIGQIQEAMEYRPTQAVSS